MPVRTVGFNGVPPQVGEGESVPLTELTALHALWAPAYIEKFRLTTVLVTPLAHTRCPDQNLYTTTHTSIAQNRRFLRAGAFSLLYNTAHPWAQTRVLRQDR